MNLIVVTEACEIGPKRHIRQTVGERPQLESPYSAKASSVLTVVSSISEELTD